MSETRTTDPQAIDMAAIEALTTAYAEEHAALAALLREREEAVTAAARPYLDPIRASASACVAARASLDRAISARPDLFSKPKTLVIDGIRVGRRKAKGRIEIADVDATVRLIKRHLADQVGTLLKTVETPIKAALSALSARDLKRIGVQVTADSEETVIAATDREVDQLVAALLREPAESGSETDAA